MLPRILFPLIASVLAFSKCAIACPLPLATSTIRVSNIEVNIEDQVAIIKSTQIFINTSNADQNVRYAFPLPQSASATDLKWKIENIWYQANIAATPPDTSFPGGPPNPDLVTHLGETPLYFTIDQVVKEPPGGAHYDYEATAENLKAELQAGLRELMNQQPEDLLARRYDKYRRMGVYHEG